MHARLGSRGFDTHTDQTLRRLAVRGLGADQGIACLIADEGLRFGALVEVFNFLRTRQQARLLAVLCVKAHAVGADGVATGYINHLPGLQAAALGQGFVQIGSCEAAAEPVGQQGFLPGIVQTQQV